MSGMDVRAFGSHVAAAIVATNACGSVRERIVRGSRIRLFQDVRESIQRSTEVWGTGIVELLEPGDNVVGTRVLQDNIKCGMELNVVKLCPFEVAVQVVRVLEESVWTGEIVEERLGQCISFVIRWRRADVRSVPGGRLPLRNLVRGKTSLFRPLHSQTLSSRMRTQATGTRVTHPIVRKVLVEHEACPQ
jgi:hypothetical protein